MRCIFVAITVLLGVGTSLFSLEVQGHRGSRGTRPENTLYAFQDAIVAGADAIHLDLQITKERELVIYHDHFLNPELCQYLDGSSIEGKVLVHSLSISKIKEIDCGSKINPRFPSQVLAPGAKILTLQEFFHWIQENPHPNAQKTKIVIKLRRDARYPDYYLPVKEFAQRVSEVVSNTGLQDRVIYASFDADLLTEVRRLNPQATLCFVKAYTLEGLLDTAERLGAQVVSPDQSLLKDKEIVALLHQKGIQVVPWTANDSKRWSELSEMGVDGILTDYPADLVRFLK